MKNKRLFLTYLFTAIGLFTPVGLHADNFTDENGNVLTFSTYEDETFIEALESVSEDEEKAGHIIIPSTVQDESGNTHSVDWISWNAFGNNTNVRSIVISDAVCAISGYAFSGCSNLTSVTFGRNMESIFYNAFQNCSALTDIYSNTIYPPNLASSVFSGCEQLLNEGTLHVPEGYAEAYAGSSWSQIPNIVADLPAPTGNVDRFKVNGMLFKILTQNSSDGYTVQVGSGHSPAVSLVIEGYIEIPSTVSYNGNNYTVKTIGKYAFSELDMYNIQVRIPSTVTHIGDYAFNWSDLTELYCDTETPPTLGVQVFSDNAYNNCTIHVDNVDAYTDSDWGQYFAFPIVINGIPYKILNASDGEYYVQAGTGTPILASNYSGTFSIPRSVDIPASRINVVAQETELNVPRHHRMTHSGKVEGTINTLKFKPRKAAKEQVVDKSVKTNGMPRTNFSRAKVMGNRDVEEETITFIVYSLGPNAFNGCTGLTKVTLPNSIREIGYSAFKNCSALTDFVCMAVEPPTLNTEDNGGVSPKGVETKGTDDLVETHPFYGMNESCVLSVPEDCIEAYDYYGWSNYFAEVEEVDVIEDPQVGDIIKVALTDDLKLKCIVTNITGGNYTIALGTGDYNKPAVDSTYVGALTIPATFNYSGKTFTITEVAPYAFNGTLITSIDLPESIISLGEGAFGYCTSLTEITGAENLININSYAFYCCSSLTSIFIPKSVIGIGSFVFQGCTSLSEVIMEDRPEEQQGSSDNQQRFEEWTSTNAGQDNTTSSYTWTIDAEAGDVFSFDYNVSSESGYDILTITVNGTQVVEASGEMTSTYSQNITSASTITVVASYSKDGSVSNGSDQARVYNIGLNLPASGVLNMGSNGDSPMFGDCPLDSVYIGRDLSFASSNGYSYSPFQSNTSLRTVVFSSQETEISYAEFADCQNLQHVVLGEGITTIGSYAFADCYNLQTIECLAETPPILQDNVFPSNIADYCKLIVEDEDAYAATAWGIYFPTPIYVDGIPYKILSAEEGYYYVQIGMGNEPILDSSFSGEFVIPRTVEIPVSKIPDTSGGTLEPVEPILNAPSLKRVTSDKEIVKTKGLPLNYYAQRVKSKENRNGEEETITFTVFSVGSKAFYGSEGLTKVTLPRSIEQIGHSAFAGCSAMTEFVSFAEQPPYLNTEEQSGPKKIKAKSPTDLIETHPFYNINDNCVLYVPEDASPTYLDYGWDEYFADIVEMEGMEIEDPQVGDVIKVLADEDVKIRYIITSTEDGHRTVALGTGNSSRLAVDADYEGELTIPATFTYSGETYTVTEVSPYAFYNCKLSAIDLPENVLSIGESAFYGCTSLTEITGAENLSSINSYAFNGCSSLTSIFIPKSVNSIGDYVFQGCTSLSQVIMENLPKVEVSEEDQQTFDGWTSTNHDNSSSSSNTWTIDVEAGDVLSFDYAVSSEGGCDILTITVNGTQIVSTSGEQSSSYSQYFGTAGTVTIYAQYSKDGSVNSGDDQGRIYNIGLNLVAGGGLNMGSNGSNSMFYDCPLDSVYIGRDLIYSATSGKGYSPFYRNTSLRSVVFSSQETEITSYEFYNCTNLQSVVIGEGITSIGTYAFYNCGNLHNISCLGQTPATLGDNALPSDIANYCTLSVENENAYVFSDWARYFPLSFYVDGIPYKVYGRDEQNNITVVIGNGSDAILTDTADSEFEIPQTIEYVDGDSTLTFPVVAIADSAFYNLTSITKVTIPATIQQIGAKAFAGCSGLTEFYSNAKVPPTINTNTANATFQSISSDCVLIVPDSCASAYMNSSWATYFSEIIEDRGENASARVGDIVAIEDENGTKIRYIITSIEEGNCTASVGTGSQNKAAVNADVTGALTIPETITAYGGTFNVTGVTNYAFYNTRISEIALPEHITSIGQYAFQGCSELTNVTGGEDITSIGQYAFYNTKLTKAFIPDNVETIGNYAFANISTLKEVVFSPKMQSINRYIINNSSNIEKVVFNGIYTEIPAEFLRYNTSVKQVTIGEQIRSIGNYAFYNNKISEINLPEGLTNIGNYAFYNCDSLHTITFPNQLTTIGQYAFYDCDGLLNITIPDNVGTISDRAFYSCDKLQEVTGCKNVTAIGEYAFYYCTSLTSIDCENITTIGQYAFYYCTSLTSFDCHDKVTTLSYEVFAHCSKLKELKGLGAVTGVGFYAICEDYELTNLEMGENLTTWNKQSSYSSSYILNLTSITLPGQTNPFTSSDSWYGLPTNLILFVPAELVEDYKSNTNTSRFTILPIGADEEKIINTENGGKLQEKLIAAGINPAEALSLTISGPINGSDIDYIHRYLVNLQTLNLENAQIVNGGDSYHQWTISSGTASQYGSNSYNTENNVVGVRMFAYMTSLERLVLPKDVTTIKEYAFSDCTKLTEVVIPDDVETIGNYAFSYERISSGTNKIASLTLPSKLKQINPYTFRYMRYLQDIVIPDSVTSIGQYAFYNCDALRTVAMGNKVTSIGQYAFYDCDALQSINLSEALDTLGTYAFQSCNNLTGPITIPATLRTIPECAFYDCTKLKNVTFNEGLITIKNYGFYNCDALTEIVLPQSVNEIQSSSFYDCDNLAKVTLPTSMKSIGQSAFRSCDKLAEVTMPEKLGSMGTYVFASCISLPSVTLPESITFLPDYTFQGCTSLTGANLATGTRRIGQYAFSGCTSLTSFDFDQYERLNQIYNYAFQNTGFVEIDLPDRIDTLFTYAFSECKSLVRAKMPTGVDYVASNLFQNCTALTEVVMHDGINRINSSAFYGCSKLPTIDLNDGITIIGASAFRGCDSLYLEKFPDNLETINNYAFYSCDKLDLDTLPAGLKTIGEYAFGYCPKLQLESLPTGLTTLNNYAFEYSGIKKMTLPEGITTLGTAIFYECDSLRQITWPADQLTIPNYTFYGCQNLQNPELPNTVTAINYQAFYNCNFTEFTFPTSLQTIGNYAFQSTYGLTEIELPISLKSIGEYAFRDSRLRSIEIPDSVTTLGAYAFYNCDSLRTAALGKNMNYAGNSYFNYFYYCDNLETLRVCSGTPPAISQSYVSNYYKKCVLEVPEGTDSIYLATDVWKDFKEIRTFLSGDKLDSLDFVIMKVIYRQLDGGNWTKKWDLSSDALFVGKWYGVTTKDGHITKINIAGNNLRGELPDSLFMLPELTELYMGNNYIGGDIGALLPETFINEKLTIIYLQSNELEGDLYPFASKFLNLEKLSMGYNRLTAISQPISKEKMTSVGTNIWFNFQFVDGKTYQPVVTEEYPATQVMLGQPFKIEWNSLQLYNHNSQDYSRTANTLGWTYVNSSNNGMNSYSYDNYFQRNSDGAYVPSNILFKFPKNTPIPLYIRWSYYNDYYVPTTIVSLDWIDGDINADLTVDVTDMQKVIYYALNDAAPSSQFYNFTSADGNGDNALDVRDAVICINRILDFDEVQIPAGVRALYSMEYNVARNNVAIEDGVVRIANADEVAALQFTITDALADDITLAPGLAGFRMTKKQVGQNVRVVIYSMTGMTLPEGEYDLLRGLDSSSALSHAVLSDEETNHLEVGIRNRVTDVDGVWSNDGDTEIYDMSGRKVTKPQKGGVYIVNGKKTIIK